MIYPTHVEPAQRIYSGMTDEEIAKARRIIEAFEHAEAAGSASIQVDGRLVDYPIYHLAIDKVRAYEALQPKAEVAG